jgi:hypothetical protein
LIDMHIFKQNRRRIGLALFLGAGLVGIGSMGTTTRAYGEGVDLCTNKAAVEKALGQPLDAGTPASLGPILPDITGQEACIFKPAANAKKNASSVTLILSKTSGPKVFGSFLNDALSTAGSAEFVLPGTDRKAFFVGQETPFSSVLSKYVDGYGVAVSLSKVTLWVEQVDADGDDDNKTRLLQLATQLVQGPYAKGNPPCDEARKFANAVFPEFTRSGTIISGKEFKPKVEKEGCSWRREENRDSLVTVTTSKAGDFKKVLAAAGSINDGKKFAEFDANGRAAFISRGSRDLATVAVNETNVLVVQLNTPGKGKLLKSKSRNIALALAPLLAE